MDSKIKAEVVSPPADGAKLGIVDKWRARVFFKETVSTSSLQSEGDAAPDNKSISWAKMIERRVAVLKVAFPFLTERQIHGKAWQECGFNSIMGGVPRSGLSPKIKKEFTKRNHFKTGQRLRIKKESKVEPCPYAFLSPKPELPESPRNDQAVNTSYESVINSVADNAETLDLFQVSGVGQLSIDESPGVPSPIKKVKKVHFNIEENSQQLTNTSYILPHTPGNVDVSKQKQYFEKMQNVSSTTASSDENMEQPLGSGYSESQEVLNDELLSLVDDENLNLPQNNQMQMQNLVTPSENIINYTDHQKDMRYDQSDQLPLDLHVTPPNNQEDIPINQQISRQNEQTTRSVIVLNTNQNFFKKNDTGIKCDNGHSGETTPLRNMEVNANKNLIMVTAQVHRSEANIIIDETPTTKETQRHQDELPIAPSPSVPGYNGYSVASCDLNKIGNADDYFKRKDNGENQNICLTPVRHINPAHLNALKLRDLRVDSKKIYENPASEMDTISNSMTFGEKPPNELEAQLAGIPREIKPNFGQMYQNQKIKYPHQSPDIYSQNFIVSLPLTPADLSEYTKLPPGCLLSNYCSEQDIAYAKADLKPVLHRNYYSDKIIKYLKDDFDQVIPPDQSLKDFFILNGKSFNRVKAEVNKKVESILSMLEKEL